MSRKKDDLSDNPFARLFPSKEEAEKFSKDVAPKLVTEIIKLNNLKPVESGASTSHSSNQLQSCNVKEAKILKKSEPSKAGSVNDAAETIFGITINKYSDKQLVYLNELPVSLSNQNLITISCLEQALFERLLMENPTENLIKRTDGDGGELDDRHVIQTEVITYLVEAYRRVHQLMQLEENELIKNELNEMSNLIIRNVSTALLQPQLYESQDIASQLFQIFYNESVYKIIPPFFDGIITELFKEEDYDSIYQLFKPVLDLVKKKIEGLNLMTFEHLPIFLFLHMMARNNILGEILIDYSTPKGEIIQGHFFEKTLLGGIFSLSCLPRTSDGAYEFFDKSSIHESNSVERTIWASLACTGDCFHQLFLSLLKLSPNVKHKTLKWLGDCLHTNAARGKLSNSHRDPHFNDLASSSVSDGFMLNLGALLLRLCEPFITEKGSPKLLKIDPTYCAAKCDSDEEMKKRHHHMRDLHSETCLLPSENDKRPASESFNFVTECFFMAQKSLELGFKTCVEKLMAINHNLATIQRAYSDAAALGGANNDVAQAIQERIEVEMSKYLSLKTALTEPYSLNLIAQLHYTSASWLVQVLLETDETPRESYILKSMKPLSFPLPETAPKTLTCIPEFILENLVSFLPFLKNFNSSTLEENGLKFLETILSCIIVYMGSCNRVRNPHLRAGLAESLESLLPHNDEEVSVNPSHMGTFCREQLFKQHPHLPQIVPSLLDVFVGIEMTGQSVQFEQKFNYRKPMYMVMDYLWGIDQHKGYLKDLAKEAEENMEAVNPPLFLRFLNLLINDSVFLLDDALSNMAQLKAMQTARDSGDWNKLQAREREENEAFFQHTRMIARFDNILGRWSIHTLEFLTSEITDIFSHPVMVDRIAAMLNYFLLNLVGPNKKNFKVKDKDEYDFKPDVFVMKICEIYVNLKESDAFCLAVSQDGRSYSPNLFKQAEDILARIGGGGLIADLNLVADKVSRMAAQQKVEEEILSDAPEEFLDPIMSTLMTDPVTLPSSHVVIDRSTIARHLLSDQTDPFNRSPLTMDMVQPNNALRLRIEDWRKQRQDERGGDCSKTVCSSKN